MNSEGYSNMQAQAQAQAQTQQLNPKQADIYDQHRQAVVDYQDACRGFRAAEASQ
jgi:hypothetical protein